MSLYSASYGQMSAGLLPPDNDKPVFRAILRAIIVAVQNLHDDVFSVFYPAIVERSKYNSCTIVLEAVLNKKFNVTSAPFIYIQNANHAGSGIVIYNRAESRPPFVIYNRSEGYPARAIYNRSEFIPAFDFIVFVPSAVYSSTLDQQLRAEVEKYKYAGVTYTVQPY